LTLNADARHICRAVLEAVCFQSKEVLIAMNKDSGKETKLIKVDGGMTNSSTCMQIQADLLDVKIENPEMKETTALGAVILAGLAVGVWKSEHEINMHGKSKTYVSTITSEERNFRFACWKRAIDRSLDLAPDSISIPTPRSNAEHSLSMPTDLLHPMNLIPILSGAVVFATFGYLLLRRF
jgi:glycerol kinase